MTCAGRSAPPCPLRCSPCGAQSSWAIRNTPGPATRRNAGEVVEHAGSNSLNAHSTGRVRGVHEADAGRSLPRDDPATSSVMSLRGGPRRLKVPLRLEDLHASGRVDEPPWSSVA